MLMKNHNAPIQTARTTHNTCIPRAISMTRILDSSKAGINQSYLTWSKIRSNKFVFKELDDMVNKNMNSFFSD